MGPQARAPGAGVPGVTRVAGIDGCRAGWVVAAGAAGDTPVVSVRADLGTVLGALDRDELAVAGIDMPIGLADGPGGRACDREARAVLGRRAVTVFSPPPRAALDAPDYPSALAVSRAVTGKGITKQAWNLAPRLREVDRAVTTARRDRLVEVHPEVAFAVLAGAPLPPKRSAAGREARIGALLPVVRGVTGLAAAPPAGAEFDDVLDALVVWWSAHRFAGGSHLQLGDGIDAAGRPMRIVA